jgi:hypothetical protein
MAAEQWTRLAPPPPPLRKGQSWNVFVSYRSVNRPWVLALYDILNGLGYKVFLDQYVLSAAAPLALSLGEALDASQSAVLIWSGRYQDSAWCAQESAKLETTGNGFRYVVARVDDAPVKGLAATKLWIDFSTQPEGPSGSGLLSLLYGLHGRPLPPEAVRLAAKADEELRQGLLDIAACRDAGDPHTLLELTRTDNIAWTSSAMPHCAVAEGLIAMQKIPEAIAVLDNAERSFPKALRVKQLRGLALARAGETLNAQLVLGRVYAAGEIDPENAGDSCANLDGSIPADGRSRFSPQVARPLPAGVRRVSVRLLHRYQRGIEELPRRREGDRSPPRPTRPGAPRSAGGSSRLLENGDSRRAATCPGTIEGAARLYRAALLAAPSDRGSLESSRRQAEFLLAALGANEDQKRAVLGEFQSARELGH